MTSTALFGDAIPKETKTAQYNRHYTTCVQDIHDLCMSSFCEIYCTSRYEKWHHSGDMMKKECLARCGEHCDMEKPTGDFDTPVHLQIRDQLLVCMKEQPRLEEVSAKQKKDDDEGENEGEDKKEERKEEDALWKKHRHPVFKKIEDPVLSALKAKEEGEKEKKKQKAEDEEKAYDDFWPSIFKKRKEDALKAEEQASKEGEKTLTEKTP